MFAAWYSCVCVCVCVCVYVCMCALHSNVLKILYVSPMEKVQSMTLELLSPST